MSLNQFELNNALLEATDTCDLKEVERLLKMGADPLGSPDESDPTDHILGELFCRASDDDKLAEILPQMIQLFFAHGMNIASRNIANDGDDINPLWDLSFVSNENGLCILKTLLDCGLDYMSAEILIDHIFTDMDMCDGCGIDDEWFWNHTVDSLKMIMLVASYPEIIKRSEYIRRCIETDNNDIGVLEEFRSWNDFDYHIDISTCTNIPHGLQNASLTIKRKNDGKAVWNMKI